MVNFMVTLYTNSKKILGRSDFYDQFRKIIIRHKCIGYDSNVMRQSACLVINPITIANFAALFNCTSVNRAPDSMMAPTKTIHFSWLGTELSVCCLVHRSSFAMQHVVSVLVFASS